MKKKNTSSAKSKSKTVAGDDGDSDGKTAATSKESSSVGGVILPPIIRSDLLGDGWSDQDVTGNPGVAEVENAAPLLSGRRRSADGGGDSKRGAAGATPNNRHFEGFARVFFQGRSDKTARQLLPSEMNDATVTSADSYLFITIDPRKSTLMLYPYRTRDDVEQADCRPVIDPPIDLVDFNAEQMPNSVCGAALFVRREAADGDPDAARRHVFRFEFRNECVVQTPERIQQLRIASKKAVQMTRKDGKNVQKAAVNFFSSHDDVEVARQLAEQKLQDSYAHYLSEIRAMQQEASSLARRFVRVVNDVSASAVASAPAAAKSAAAPSVVSSMVGQQPGTTTKRPFVRKKNARRARGADGGDASEEGTYASSASVVVEDTDNSDGQSHVS